MSFKKAASKCFQSVRMTFVALMIFQFSLGGPMAPSLQAHDKDDSSTRTPIKHVIVLIGENRTFDHLFATYVSPSGDSVNNLLSEGIIKADGTPERHFWKAKQFQAIAPFKKKYFISLDDDDKDAYGI